MVGSTGVRRRLINSGDWSDGLERKGSNPLPTRGGNSTYSKALLAEHTGTTIPKGYMILVCHACNNAKCSNPKHLYWGTPSENRMDRVRYENRTLIEIMEDHYRKRKVNVT
ncbi:MAG: hypothetical protein EBT86_05960 [Actinobacteria bacterium]|nr:hypothetical protein [Actinomycetota bacterium]